MSHAYTAAAVIPTRNRKDMLRQAIRSCLAQTVRMQVVVVDDGSDDGTDRMMAAEFPEAVYRRFDGPNGPCVLRNRGSRLADAPILFPIDDDAEFVSPRTVEQTLENFDHPRVAIVGIPYVNVRIGPEEYQRAKDPGRLHAAWAFVGASHAVRRDVFLDVGGYREELFYMGEEGDLSLRLLRRGYVTRFGTADALHHHESPIRSKARAGYYGRRNDVLTTWYNVPWPYLPVHLAATTVNGVRFGLRVGEPGLMIRGLLGGYGAAARRLTRRDPVPGGIHRLSRRLKGEIQVPLDEIEHLLPPVSGAGVGTTA